MKPKEAKRLISRYRKAFEAGNTKSVEALFPSVKQLLVECFTDDLVNQKHFSPVVYELYKLPPNEMQKILQSVYKVTYQITKEQLEEANEEAEVEDYITKMFLNYKPD